MIPDHPVKLEGNLTEMAGTYPLRRDGACSDPQEQVGGTAQSDYTAVEAAAVADRKVRSYTRWLGLDDLSQRVRLEGLQPVQTGRRSFYEGEYAC